MKLLLDMNLSPKLAEALISKGYTAVHWITVGAMDALDAEIMTYAKDNDYVVVTHDLGFSAILSVTHGQLPSIIQIRAQALNISQIAEMISASVKQYTDEILQGAILSIDTDNSRLRLLPL